MTTPDTNEFMRQLDQDPDLLEEVRARILTREPLRLPETVAQLVGAQQETAGQLDTLQEAQQQTNQRLDTLTGSVQRIEGTLGKLTDTAYENRATPNNAATAGPLPRPAE